MNNKILFVTQTMHGTRAACGIGLIGKLIGETLLKHPEFKFELLYADDFQTIEHKVKEFEPAAIVYNYAPGTTPWMDYGKGNRDAMSDIKHIRIMHDMHQGIANAYHPESNYGWQYIIADDPTITETNYVFATNRLLPPGPRTNYVDTGIPVIGFQGFSSIHGEFKGIRRLAYQVAMEFDHAIIRLHIPYGFYGDPAGYAAQTRVHEVRSIVAHKPGIQVLASHELLSTQEIVDLLTTNTVNCYFYDYLDGAGLASSPDYALAAGRPIAVARSHQMRHFWNLQPSILIEQNSLRKIIDNGLEPLKTLYEDYSPDSVYKDYSRILKKILGYV